MQKYILNLFSSRLYDNKKRKEEEEEVFYKKFFPCAFLINISFDLKNVIL